MYSNMYDETRGCSLHVANNLLQVSLAYIGGWTSITIDGIAVSLIQLGPLSLALFHQVRDANQRSSCNTYMTTALGIQWSPTPLARLCLRARMVDGDMV
jgi:hypothetical protein